MSARNEMSAATLVRAISAKGIERSALSGLSAMSLRSPMSPLSPMSARSPRSPANLANAANLANLANAASPRSQKAKSKCNNDITTRKKHSSFIFFGCWNNVNCEKEFIFRDIVLDYINRNEEAVKQLYIAGDNWYTNAKKINAKNFKVYLTDVLTRGYDKLYSMKKEIYIAVGNHDEDKDATMTNPRLQKDCNVNTQKYYLKQIKERRDGRDDRRPPRGAIREPTLDELNFLASKGRLTDNYLCKKGVYIYVDDIGVRYNEGNIVIIINTNKFGDYEEGLAYLESIRLFINDVVAATAASGEQIFVMGHIPLFNFKKDKIKIQDINKKEPIYRNIIVGLFNMFVENRIIYICADTHNFSIMRIKCNGDDARVLIQITAGSGGADPDLLTKEYATSPTTTKVKDEIVNNKFEIEAYALNSYGYATITTGSDSDSVSVCYKQIIKDIDDTTKTASGTSGSDTKITEITYKVNTMDKTIVVEKHGNSRAAINTYKNKEVCDKIKKQKRGYITSLDHKTVCYMKKDKKAKE